MRPITLCWRAVTLSAVLVVASLAVVGPAEATFPGVNGKIAYQTDRDGNYEIYTINPDATNDTRITTNLALDSDPAWSPDGKQIAFVSNRDGNDEIYKMNADGTSQTRLTTNSASDREPAWSGDGTQIVFASTRVGGVFHIYKMNADGTGVTPLTSSSGGADTQPAWSPDGKKIAFVSNRDGNNEIYKMNADGTLQTNLTVDGASEERPSWAPYGTQIAFDSDLVGGSVDVWVMNADGTNSFAVSGLGGPGFQGDPFWLPTASYVFFPQLGGYVSNTGGTDQIAGYTNNASNNSSPDMQPVSQFYARPRGATPILISLVEAYNPCYYPNTFHKGAITSAACNPPSATSSYLTVGTLNANGQAANSIGSVRIDASCIGGPCDTTPGDQLDGKIVASITDVRCLGTSGGCAGGSLSDYLGSVSVNSSVRITDMNSVGSGAATVGDLPLSFTMACSSTPSASIGSTCSANTSLDAVFGGEAVVENARAIWHFGEITVYDGGQDGVASTAGDNTLFAWSGLFFP
jgi:Tol biopolymer transport system component